MVYFQLAVFTWASLYGKSTPSTAWRTSGHKLEHTLKQPYLRGVVDATLPGLPASAEILWFTSKRIVTLQVMSMLVTKHPSPTFFFTVWLIAKKVILLEIMNAELTASTSSWTQQWMKVESDKPQTRQEPWSVWLPGKQVVGQAPPGHFSFTNSNNLLFFSEIWQE